MSRSPATGRERTGATASDDGTVRSTPRGESPAGWNKSSRARIEGGMKRTIILLTVAMALISSCGPFTRAGDDSPAVTGATERGKRPLSGQKPWKWKNGKVRVRPGSGPAKVGREYRYEVGHCGLTHVVDFDGSLWDVIWSKRRQPFFFINWDHGPGTMTLLSENRARYVSARGVSVDLERHEGPKYVHLCW